MKAHSFIRAFHSTVVDDNCSDGNEGSTSSPGTSLTEFVQAIEKNWENFDAVFSEVKSFQMLDNSLSVF